MSARLLLVEDDLKMVALVRDALKEADYLVESTLDGKTGLARALNGGFDVVLLDIKLPDVSGFEICAAIRNADPFMPIVMLTAQHELSDKVQGLMNGADDYITKPFEPLELVARLNAVRRRADLSRNLTKKELVFGALKIDIQARRVHLNGRQLDLTLKEFDILVFLSARPGQIFSRKDLMREIWGITASAFEPTVTVHISRLRAKIEADVNSPVFIHTVTGSGYRFATVEETQS